ncbi:MULTISPECIES: hypothetical protein [Shewanella]|uniref:DUF2474 domain-containing protein n=3 Tax=Shewanella TaxID=22 RepID=A0A220UMW6_9GAMM|nr:MULTISPECIES: hypothetical protein [Shewanella]ABI39041.1 conserved hypothetical protein [Shewanella sp. MR-4]ABK48285.1 conserved hypothetical protein [Shewanella sp. ANA-3]ASK69256.1 hypothetical protein CF168_10445 [Shewanella bicestrii]MDH0448658.1 hypothetical protein [Shewanella sp. GD04112]MDH1470390.1 hypothetical protein [Shewanella sp. GD03713]
MDKGQRYLRWLSYTAVIAVFCAVMLATLGKAVWVVLENVK